MSRRFSPFAFAFVLALSAACGRPADAAPTFATVKVSAALPHAARGHDAGIDVASAAYVRLTASGSLAFDAYGACRRVGPNGCASALSFNRIAPSAATGELVAAFVDARGAFVSGWAAVGEAAYVAVPSGASRMLLRVNGATGREYGAYTVVADAVAPTQNGTGVRRLFSTARQIVGGTSSTRAQVQYALRRLAFSASPEDVTAVVQGGLAAWVTQQLNPSAIDDSALANFMEPVPMLTGNTTTDNGYDRTLERRLVQREVATKRQLLEKVTMHWLEHFAISEDKVFSPGGMALYEDTVRADALGNFKQLVIDVSEQPAMLRWLDNNYNSGANPATQPPNENFGRELMQLYTLGINELNPDGTPILDSNGQPIPAYTDTDVKQVALALTGFQTYVPYPTPTGDPRTFEHESFNPQAHAKGPYTVIGRTIADTGDTTIVNAVVDVLVRNPTCAPFQVKELLQRFVTESPSPGYVSRMAAVWNQYVDDPNQIAKVIAAMVADPEFTTSRNSMVKEPLESEIDAVRELEGAAANPITSTVPHPLDSLYGDELNLGQGLWYPPSVFSFYRPGEKSGLITNAELLTLWGGDAHISAGANVTKACTNCVANLNLTSLATQNGQQIASFLLDALVDGGTPELRALLTNYIANTPSKVPGAIWIVMSSPEYEVN